jgi:molybdopterin-containing oxidoreductase family iron-sulfur binding subunit
MSKHYQFESNFSLTGANADYRFPLKSSKEANVVLTLYSIIESKVKKTPLNITKISNFNEVLKVADDL